MTQPTAAETLAEMILRAAGSGLPPVPVVRALLTYDPVTGLFKWRSGIPSYFKAGLLGREVNCATWNKRYAGKPAFTSIGGNGYLLGEILSRKYLAHRVAWALHTGEWPKAIVDHANGDPKDNRWCNLRLATKAQNGQNAKTPKHNRSGVKGVSRRQGRNSWRAQLRVDGRYVFIGNSVCLGVAINMVRKARSALHGDFACHCTPRGTPQSKAEIIKAAEAAINAIRKAAP